MEADIGPPWKWVSITIISHMFIKNSRAASRPTEGPWQTSQEATYADFLLQWDEADEDLPRLREALARPEGSARE
jgi:hypothetical protein